MRRFKSKKGFTLAELLVVVAIIAVLVAVAIPVFSTQLNSAKLATDHAMIREAYAHMQYAKITEEITVDGVTMPISKCHENHKFYLYLSKDGSLVTDLSKVYKLQASEDTCEQLEKGEIVLPNGSTYSYGHTKDYSIAIQVYEVNSNVELILIAT